MYGYNTSLRAISWSILCDYGPFMFFLDFAPSLLPNGARPGSCMSAVCSLYTFLLDQPRKAIEKFCASFFDGQFSVICRVGGALLFLKILIYELLNSLEVTVLALRLASGYWLQNRQTLTDATVPSTKMKPYGVVSVVSRFRLDRGKLESTCQTYAYRRVLPRLVPTTSSETKWHFFTNTTHSTLLVSSAGMWSCTYFWTDIGSPALFLAQKLFIQSWRRTIVIPSFYNFNTSRFTSCLKDNPTAFKLWFWLLLSTFSPLPQIKFLCPL